MRTRVQAWCRRYRTLTISGLAVASALALTGVGAGSAALAGTTGAAGASGAAGTTGVATAGTASGGPQVVPEPVSMTAGRGRFALTAGTRIVAGPGAASVAGDLAGYLRPATGYRPAV